MGRYTTWIEDDVLGKVEVREKTNSDGNIEGPGWEYVNPHTENARNAILAARDREPFEYSAENDPTYRQYRSAAEKSGKLAMKDTIGQIAAMNGGYASSYAQTAGQQVYQGALDDVDNMIPELYEIARERYDRETDNLQANVDTYVDAYDRWNDTRIEDLTGINEDLTKENEELKAKGLTPGEIIAAQNQLDKLAEEAELAYSINGDTSGYEKMILYLNGLNLSEDELPDWLKIYGLTQEIFDKIYGGDTEPTEVERPDSSELRGRNNK